MLEGKIGKFVEENLKTKKTFGLSELCCIQSGDTLCMGMLRELRE